MATPPDVRKVFDLPETPLNSLGYAHGFTILGQSPEYVKGLTEGQRPSAHRAAKPNPCCDLGRPVPEADLDCSLDEAVFAKALIVLATVQAKRQFVGVRRPVAALVFGDTAPHAGCPRGVPSRAARLGCMFWSADSKCKTAFAVQILFRTLSRNRSMRLV
jgi:hypothetical protein